jgi:electron transfer flavoprotein alpha subunit
MTTLLVAEHAGGALNDATSKAMTAAAALGSDVHVLVAGKGVQGVAEAAAKLSGAAKVLVAESDALEHQLAEPMADLVLSLAGDYDAIVAPATANGKNILAARRRPARRDAALRRHRVIDASKPSSGRSTPATRFRRSSRTMRRRSSPSEHPRSQQLKKAVLPLSKQLLAQMVRVCPNSLARNFPSPTARN